MNVFLSVPGEIYICFFIFITFKVCSQHADAHGDMLLEITHMAYCWTSVAQMCKGECSRAPEKCFLSCCVEAWTCFHCCLGQYGTVCFGLEMIKELTEAEWDVSVMCLTAMLCKSCGFLCYSCHCSLRVFSRCFLSWTSAEQSRPRSWRLPPCSPRAAMVLGPACCHGSVVW